MVFSSSACQYGRMEGISYLCRHQGLNSHSKENSALRPQTDLRVERVTFSSLVMPARKRAQAEPRRDVWQRPLHLEGLWSGSMGNRPSVCLTQVEPEGPKAGVWPKLTPQYAARIWVLVPDQQLSLGFKHVYLKETPQHSLMCKGGASRAQRPRPGPPDLEQRLASSPSLGGTQLKQHAFLSETSPSSWEEANSSTV